MMGDGSRVASMGVMLLHLYSHGVYTQAPLKIQLDSSIAGSEDVATASFDPSVMGTSKFDDKMAYSSYVARVARIFDKARCFKDGRHLEGKGRHAKCTDK